MAEIKKINVNGVEYDIAGGGSELYLHNIQLGNRLCDTIINNDSTPFTTSTYGALLKQGGYTQQYQGKPVNNVSVIYPENTTHDSLKVLVKGTVHYVNATTTHYQLTTMTITINDDFTVTKKVGYENGGFSLTDKVIKL